MKQRSACDRNRKAEATVYDSVGMCKYEMNQFTVGDMVVPLELEASLAEEGQRNVGWVIQHHVQHPTRWTETHPH
jgi:hypothetical protein